MSQPATERADAALLALLAAAEPRDARLLGGLMDRLALAGHIRGELAPAARQCPIRGIAYDSRRVVPGGLFVAVPGEHVDGHDFVDRAVAAGAVAVLLEHEVPDAGSVAQLVVDRGRLALAVAAAWWYGDPGRALGVIGVTGTDGKTTTAAMAVAALEAAGVRTGLVSTADQRIGGRRADTPTHVTTPEAPELQRALRAMVEAGDAAAVVETSSHGLALERVGEVPYDIAILTNLTHEHLELHGTFEAYRDAKRSLFARLAAGADASPKPATLPGGRRWPRGGIVNLDDPSAGVFADATRGAGAAVLTYGTSHGADVRATAIHETPGGIQATVATPRGVADVTLPLVGRFNVHNALAVVALAELLGLDGDAICRGLAGFAGVRGRMERVDRGQPFLVVVDYAHTPAALATALDALAPLVGPRGGLVAVFGSAGERDVAKRAIQGRVAGDRCRLVIATDEDPRGEDPVAILEQIAEGAEAAGRRRDEDLLLIPDREAAIREAFGRARPGDVVLLAGKGNEREILYAGHETAWDERAVAERLLAEMGFASVGRPSPS